jgi:UDP-N-acetyl-D-mannosaminuronic acid dehydrogenase
VRAVVVALGKIGLPIAAQIASHGHHVIGCDVDPRVVESVNAGRAPFPGEAGLDEALERLVGSGQLRAVGDTASAVAEGAELVIAVPPLVVDDQARPDFAVLDTVISDIARGLRPGTTVSVETTLPVGTTRDRVAPALAAGSGLRSEEGFFTIHSPERVYSGRIFRDLATYPKIVGGLTAAGEARGVELYESFLDAPVWSLGSAEAAELTKLAETTYRDMNIAYANELARHADELGIDIERVIDAANSQPFSHIHRPGVAVGGHCIPVYPRFYLSGNPAARLPAVAREINESMPAYALDLIGDVTGQRVVILGVTYRGAVKEPAFSGAFGLRDELTERGARAFAADPMYTDEELLDLGFEPWDGKPVDAAVIQSDHPEYAELRASDLPGIRVLVDGRNIIDAKSWLADGVEVRRIGRP